MKTTPAPNSWIPRRGILLLASLAGSILIAPHINAQIPFTVSVTKAGTGSGTVTSSLAGINCGATCSAQFPYMTTATLTAVAAAGSTFAGWSGSGCSGTGAWSLYSSTGLETFFVTATFTASGPLTLTVTKAGSGTGTVTSSPAGINCGPTCSASYAYGTPVTLLATPTPPSPFAGGAERGAVGRGRAP